MLALEDSLGLDRSRLIHATETDRNAPDSLMAKEYFDKVNSFRKDNKEVIKDYQN